MKLGFIVYSNDPETLSNALQVATYARRQDDQVRVFLLGKGVEAAGRGKTEAYAMQPFKISEDIQALIDTGGQVLASQRCLDLRGVPAPDMCRPSSIKDLYEMIKESDRTVTF